MPKIKVNTFGEGIEIRQLQLEPETYHYWNTIATRKNIPLSDLLLDPFFYYGLKDSKFKELKANAIIGMVNTSKSHVEIWFNRHKILKIKSQELFNEMLLFPLFNVKQHQDFLTPKLENGIYVMQKRIGLLSSQQLEITSQQLSILVLVLPNLIRISF